MTRAARLALAATLAASVARAADVSVREDASSITVANGLVSATISKQNGELRAFSDLSGATPMPLGSPRVAMYWDANGERLDPPADLPPGPKKGYFRPSLAPDAVRVLSKSADAVEISVKGTGSTHFPFDVDYRYTLRRDVPGLYASTTLSHAAGQPGGRLWQTRFVFRTVEDGTFKYWSTHPNAIVPIPQAEVVQKVTDATFRLADGTVKTKYQNSVYWADAPVYGVIGSNATGKPFGLWMIEASPEYHNGGPVKQGQTVHDAVLLRVLQSAHFGASPADVPQDESWRKTYGPFLLYVNHGDSVADLWRDAEARKAAESKAWPYAWSDAPGYVHERGTVTGRVTLAGNALPASATIILSDPSKPWTEHANGYNFWTKPDAEGRFTIDKVVPGTYDLHVTGANQPTDFEKQRVTVTADKTLDLGTLDWTPETHGKALWTLGTFDRSAAEFRNGDDARDYQMFTRYAEQFPDDVDFTIGKSDPKRDWNYAQWTFFNKRPEWRIHFDADAPADGKATLTIGVASSQPRQGKTTDLRVAINGSEIGALQLPKTGTAGYRGGTQDSPYAVIRLTFDASMLKQGENVLTFRHADAVPYEAPKDPSPDAANEDAPPSVGTPGQIMYDAIRLEVAPASPSAR